MAYCIIWTLLLCIPSHLYGQCTLPTINDSITIQYECRNINITDVSINKSGKNTISHVEPKAHIHLKFNYYFTQGCPHCMDDSSCIVHFYWGINNYHSECFMAFYGIYERSFAGNYGTVSNTFIAPEKSGVYYITIGATESTTCLNDISRPFLSKEFAIAAIVVGTPINDAVASIEAKKLSNSVILRAKTDGVGCTGLLNSYKWYKNDILLIDSISNQISISESGLYKVTCFNQTGDELSVSYNYKPMESNDSLSKDIVKPRNTSTNLLNATVKVQLYDDSTKNKLSGTIFLESEESEDSKVIKSLSNSINGEYIFTIPKNSNYRIYANVNGYFGSDIIVKKEEFNSSPGIEKEIRMIPLKKGIAIPINNIIFEQGNFNLLPLSKPQLDHLSDLLKSHPDIRIRLEGHTDNVGDPQKDLILSLERANTIKKYLINKGIYGSRIETKGYGGTKPIASNATEETRKQNRRVEVIIL